MREVEPRVFLIAKPSIDWESVCRYLAEVGGESWYERKEQARDNAETVQEMRWSDGEDLIEFAGRLCYRSWEPGLNKNVTKIREDAAVYFENLLKSGHGSVLEHSNYSFVIHNCTRVTTHELVRHRAGCAYSQESMRFVRLDDIPFWIPDWAKEDATLMRNIKTVVEAMEEFQEGAAEHFALDDETTPFSEKKAKTSFMRRFAPQGVGTGIVMTANVRALRHIITMRTEAAAEEEIRIVCDQIARIMQDECPLLFQDFSTFKTDQPAPQWEPENRKV